MLGKFHPYGRVEKKKERESRSEANSETNSVIPPRDGVDKEPNIYWGQGFRDRVFFSISSLVSTGSITMDSAWGKDGAHFQPQT